MLISFRRELGIATLSNAIGFQDFGKYLTTMIGKNSNDTLEIINEYIRIKNNMTNRLEWIDNIKGVGILCVVLGHIAFMPFNKTEWMLGSLFPMFYMSMFFMASGYVGYNIFARNLTWKDVVNYKNFTLLIPFLILGLSYTALRNHQQGIPISLESLSTLFTTQAKNGYWFIYSLFFFRLISIVIIYIEQKMRIYNFYLQCLGILIVGGNFLLHTSLC